MDKPTLFYFEQINSSVTDLKSISKKVGAVAVSMSSCAKTLSQQGSTYASYEQSARRVSKNLNNINTSLIDMYRTIERVKEIYYHAETENYRIITGAKAYETLNFGEKLVYHGKKIGNAVVSEISQIHSALSTMSVEDYLRLGVEVAKLGAVTVAAALVLGSYVATAPTGLGIVLAGLTLAKSISLVSRQMESTYAAFKGDFSKTDNVTLTEVAFSFIPAIKYFPAIQVINNHYGIPVSDIIGAGFEGFVDLTNLGVDKINYHFGVGDVSPNAVVVGENVALSFIEEGVGVLGNDWLDLAVKSSKLGYEFLRAYAFGY